MLSLHISVNCEWGPWGLFSPCTKTCGMGKMHRTRSKSVIEQNGGICNGRSREEKTCNSKNCPGKMFLFVDAYILYLYSFTDLS